MMSGVRSSSDSGNDFKRKDGDRMMMPNPVILSGLVQDREQRLNGSRQPRQAAPGVLRVRIGRALIAAGSMVSGERVELPARPPALSRAA
jgi:hypothetical protein